MAFIVVAIPCVHHHEKEGKFHVKFRSSGKKKREKKYEMRLVELNRGQFYTRHHKFCSLHTAQNLLKMRESLLKWNQRERHFITILPRKKLPMKKTSVLKEIS